MVITDEANQPDSGREIGRTGGMSNRMGITLKNEKKNSKSNRIYIREVA
jgi:hypothetical protein